MVENNFAYAIQPSEKKPGRPILVIYVYIFATWDTI